jgi:hypothetical protein
MRTAWLSTTAALFTALAVGGPGPADAKRPHPHLRVAASAPVKVSGTYFRARERVKIVVVLEEQQSSRFVRASRLGSFTTAFATVYVHPCSSGGTVTAIGSLGSRAAAKIPPQPECPPPP